MSSSADCGVRGGLGLGLEVSITVPPKTPQPARTKNILINKQVVVLINIEGLTFLSDCTCYLICPQTRT